ncbi:putative eka-like protein [Erysiphe necator]|uniref:Putative eka-like protein n=1 Tax=Uncinula necator TaxID=52586 RepID=A0A0B1PA58_UNCNE|nr:putative eka-like protein [Erysiphe necator]
MQNLNFHNDSMDTSQESQALSTESSNQPPPLRQSLHYTIPPPLSHGRQILKPVAPSKRPIIERPTPSCSNKINIENAFLPKELAEIVAIRQRRERAWHARFMICKTAISSIESSLANFKDEIEVEDVAAFKAYLKLAIANFAAVDTAPTPPKIPSHSRPSKGSRHGLGVDKIAANKVATAIPRSYTGINSSSKKTQGTHSLPNIPEKLESTWATVARKGKKKARITLSTNAPLAPVRKETQSSTSKNKSPTRDSPKIAVTDRRLFVRLPHEHEWRKLSPAGIREVIVKKLAISPALFGKIKPVHSGFALSPCSTEARETMLNAGNRLFLSGAKLEPATNWTSVIVPTVPATIRKEQGEVEVEVNKCMLTEEIERVCQIRPAHVKLYGGIKPGAPHRTWMAYFPTAPRRHRVETAGQLTTQRSYVWLQLSAEIAVVPIGPTVVDVLHAQLVQVHLPRSS